MSLEKSSRQSRGPRRQAVEIALLRDVSQGLPSAHPSETGRPLPDRRMLARGILDAAALRSTGARPGGR
jgi:hypothetical protein